MQILHPVSNVPLELRQPSSEGPSRPRVLLQAYACSPYRGGEQAIGWHRAVESAKYFDTWVLCKQQQYEPDVKRYFVEHGEIPGLHFRFIPRSRFEKLLKQIPGLSFLAYNLWSRRAYREAFRLHRELQFNLMHQVNLNSYREPGYLWKLDAPFVWGPVGGTQNYPWRFLRYAGLRGAVVEGVRSILNNLQFRFSRRVDVAARRATALLTANSQGQRDFARVHQLNSHLLLDVGIRSVPGAGVEGRAPDGPVKIMWSGLLQHRKALHLLLLALSQLPEAFKYELKILGRGPLQNRWQRMARKLGVEAHCTWLGWLSHEEALKQYKWADLFVFTSLRDTSGTVVLEALSHGVPVICLNHQGAGDMVTPECGIKIPPTEPAEVISALKDAIVTLSQNKSSLSDLSRGALRQAEKYLWARNAEEMAGICSGIILAQTQGSSMGREVRPNAPQS
jgi:glycosyltransferase involved in cell wall biosynthesis